eukprot:s108_g28.t1
MKTGKLCRTAMFTYTTETTVLFAKHHLFKSISLKNLFQRCFQIKTFQYYDLCVLRRVLGLMSDKLGGGHRGTYKILSETPQGYVISLEDVNETFLLCRLPGRVPEDPTTAISASKGLLQRGAGRGTSKTIPSWVHNETMTAPSLEVTKDVRVHTSVQVGKEWEEYVDPATGKTWWWSPSTNEARWAPPVD